MIIIGSYSIFDIIFFLRRKVLSGFKIHRQDLVIDIGSGDKPFWRADVFFDNLDLKDDQRFTQVPTVTELGMFVGGDIHTMPFKDTAFDFSFCSHVLEHIENPALAIQEITRISKRGYIEVPNGITDSIRPFSTHLWFIYLNGKKLVFMKKDKRELSILTKNGLAFLYLLRKIKNPVIELYWENEIEYEIIDPTQKPTRTEMDVYLTQEHKTHSTRYYIWFITILRKLFLVNKNIHIESLYKNKS